MGEIRERLHVETGSSDKQTKFSVSYLSEATANQALEKFNAKDLLKAEKYSCSNIELTKFTKENEEKPTYRGFAPNFKRAVTE